jgi:glycosyltransferase involved in cell wall biosynthesis
MPEPTTRPQAPPGWPITDRPLRIAILGWARLSLQAREGSGYNLSASELAAGLALSGHHVSYLASGIRYSPIPGPRIRPLERWRGIDCSELVNSPNCSPAACNFRNMAREIANPGQCRAVVRWLEQRGIQVVHIHSLEGYPLDLIGAIRDSARPVVVTPHNYWYVCPQVDLLHEEVRVCTDYDGGRRCPGCMNSKPYATQRTARTLGQSLEAVLGPRLADMARKSAYGLVERLGGRGETSDAAVSGEGFIPDPALARGFEADPSSDGRISHWFAPESPAPPEKPLGSSPPDQNERFLAPEARAHHLAILDNSIYGRRRHAGIAALNRASLVTPPSEFLRRVHLAMGLDESLTRVVRLGQPHFDQIHRRTRRSPFYRTRPWDPRSSTGPLRLAFFGVTRPNKGLDVLIRAIALLPREVRQQCQFLIRAGGWDWPFRKRAAEFPEVQFAGGYDLLQLLGAGGEYDVGILPHIWFENSPLVLLEHLHAGKFVIASRLGGPPEWVVEPPAPRYNGLLFPAGHPEALAACIERVVRAQVMLPTPEQIHQATPLLQSYPAHVAEFAALYAGLLADPPHAPPAGRGTPLSANSRTAHATG